MTEPSPRNRLAKAAFILVMLLGSLVVIKNFIQYMDKGCITVPVEGPELWPTNEVCGTAAIIAQVGLPLVLILIPFLWNPFHRHQ